MYPGKGSTKRYICNKKDSIYLSVGDRPMTIVKNHYSTQKLLAQGTWLKLKNRTDQRTAAAA